MTITDLEAKLLFECLPGQPDADSTDDETDALDDLALYGFVKDRGDGFLETTLRGRIALIEWLSRAA